MKQKLTDTAFVFNRYGVRINGFSTNTDFMLKDTAFVPLHQFNRYGVRTPSIYTKGRRFIYAHIHLGNQLYNHEASMKNKIALAVIDTKGGH